MLAPVGALSTYEATRPVKKQVTESRAEHIHTDLKLLQMRIAVIQGKIIRLDIKSAPIILIPSTIVTAVSIAITVL